MKLKKLLKNWKNKSRITKTFVWFAAILLLLVILTTLPNIHTAFGFERAQVILAQSSTCRRARTGDPRDPSLANIPYLISPRHTLLLTNKPKLRWNSALGVKQYTASLVKGDKTIWQTTLDQHEIIYPGEPKLEAGAEYLLIIKADNGKSSQDEEASQQWFRFLPTAEVGIVKATLNNKQLTDKNKALASAYIYSGFGLKAEAIDTLEKIKDSGIKKAVLYKKLAELYWETGVYLEAEINYLQAVKLAIAARDIPEQAQISAALGELYVEIGDEKEAIKWFNQARDSHKTLGNTQRIKELDAEIEELKSSL
ncbi:MAG: tetratricopeptide repeat protein [Nostoc sp.]|uniref:tetratricopeptide repeat protein n=1 Tax=Nostoc sp. TaxID=1180 RepID=UPI002FF45DEB